MSKRQSAPTLRTELQQQDARTVLASIRDNELARCVLEADDLQEVTINHLTLNADRHKALAASLEDVRDQLTTVIDGLPESKTWITAECPNYAALRLLRDQAQNAIAAARTKEQFISAVDGIFSTANAAIRKHEAKIAAQPLNTEDSIAAAIDRDKKAKGIDWQGVGVIDTRKRTDSIGVHLGPHNWQQTR